MRFRSWEVAALLVLVGFVRDAHGQCGRQWLPGYPEAGVRGPVECLGSWDPDGAGPMTKRLVVAGTFPVAGSVPSRSVALFEPGTGSWSGLGVGVSGDVRCLAGAFKDHAQSCIEAILFVGAFDGTVVLATSGTYASVADSLAAVHANGGGR